MATFLAQVPDARERSGVETLMTKIIIRFVLAISLMAFASYTSKSDHYANSLSLDPGPFRTTIDQLLVFINFDNEAESDSLLEHITSQQDFVLANAGWTSGILGSTSHYFSLPVTSHRRCFNLDRRLVSVYQLTGPPHVMC